MQTGRFPSCVAVQRESIHARLRLNEIHLSVERALYYHMPKVNWQVPATRFTSFGEKS